MAGILDLFNYISPFCKRGIFVIRYEILICLTVDLFLYRGYSLLGTRGGKQLKRSVIFGVSEATRKSWKKLLTIGIKIVFKTNTLMVSDAIKFNKTRGFCDLSNYFFPYGT